MICLVRPLVLVALFSVFWTPAFAQSLPATRDFLEGGKGLLLSDAVEYDQKTEELRASGNVEIFFKDRRLFADELIYSPREDQVRANGNVKVVDPDGSVVFADTVELTGDLATGVIENISARYGEFAKLAARRGVREGDNISRLEDASYSPCKVCAETPDPLWQIVAEEVEHDQTEQTITYKNPRLEVLGQPILYVPYFQHPDPNVKRKTGLLQPRFFGSSELGSGIETPYFINLAPNRDITISPLFLTNALPLVNIEYRARTEAGRYTLSASGTVGDRSEGTNVSSQRNFRGSLFGDGRFDINEDTAWGFDIERASDDTFLRLYEITNDDRLTS
jgi:LPS-assembly protein